MKATEAPNLNYRVIPAGKFKATCLQLIDEVFADRNLTIIVTKRGKPLAQLAAPPPEIKLSTPQVLLPTEPLALQASKSTASEEPRKKKRKGKKKKK